MRVIPLKRNPAMYSCLSYLVLGEWNRIDDVNTLIDPGIDDFVLTEIERLSTGFGKVPVEQIVLTHNHFDHSAGVAAVKRRYGARVLAFSPGPDVDELLYNAQVIKMGDELCEILHTPGHSSDSVCIFVQKERVLFSGDTQVRILSAGGVYTEGYLSSLRMLAERRIEKIYSGHDEPVLRDGWQTIARTLSCVMASSIIAT